MTMLSFPTRLKTHMHMRQCQATVQVQCYTNQTRRVLNSL